ncbi:MAG: hypothetical protein L6R40_004193 [Gallowayella cf. fulva]|nr:MAG: hypothetical protein L6R40_004193 [Xanthomendoza cf. fulva]
MPSFVGAPQTHSQRSRKGKKAWRKNVDVSEVQEGLENAREEIIKGGIVAEKPSDALFTVDTSGSDKIRKSHQSSKPLKVDEILAARSAVPAISTRKRLGVTDGVIDPTSKRRKGNGVKPQEYERLRRLAYGGDTSLKDAVQTKDVPSHDPWAPAVTDNAQDAQLSYLEKPKPVKAPSTLGKPPTSLLASNSTIPAVPQPKPGTSYNPVFQDWDTLLTSAGAKEIAAERARLAEAAAEEVNQTRIAAALAERDDDYKTEEESAWEGFESEYETEQWLKKKRPERKTPSERNKVKRRKEAERQAKWEAQMKKREKQQKQILEIAKQVEKDAKARETSTAVIAANDGSEGSDDGETNDQVLRRRKFGKTKLPETPLELVLPDELRDSLRLLKPEGNLLRDRFRNIMLRGKLETRNPISQPKKARRSTTEKWTYKDFRVPGEV